MKIILTFIFGIGLIFSTDYLYAQDSLSTAVQNSAGGPGTDGEYKLFSTMGQPSPLGRMGTTANAIYSGFSYTFDYEPMMFWLSAPTSVNENQEIDLKIKTTTIRGIKDVTLFYRKGGEADFDSKLMINSNGQYQASIPENKVTSCGVEYKVTATDSDGFVNRSPLVGYYSIQVKIPAPGLMKTTEHPYGKDKTNYRLISVPLGLNNRNVRNILVDDFGDYNPEEWRLFKLLSNQTTSKSYEEYNKDTDGNITIDPGLAFWLIVKNPTDPFDTGSGESNITSKEFAITLHPKWNLIGNPFNFNIPLTHLRLQSGRVVTLRSFSGEWNQTDAPVTEMVPFEGYALFNDSTSPDTLFINPDFTKTGTSIPKEKAITRQTKTIWSIQIQARCQQARDCDNVAAVTTGASDKKDNHDLPEPPVIGEYVSLYFPHPEWKSLCKRYCTDFRAEPTDGLIWEFEVQSNIQNVVKLTFKGIEDIPLDYEVWLLDDTLKVSQNLRTSNLYSTVGATEKQPRRFQLLVGGTSFIQGKFEKLQLIPTDYELSQNFPNPFNPTTRIRFGLPQAGNVTLKIYNLLGKEVATLLNNEKKEAGYHILVWDSKNYMGQVVANGIYIYKFQSGSFSETRKMTLLK